MSVCLIKHHHRCSSTAMVLDRRCLASGITGAKALPVPGSAAAKMEVKIKRWLESPGRGSPRFHLLESLPRRGPAILRLRLS